MAHIGCETETELRPSNKSVKSWLTGHLGSAVTHGDVAHWHIATIRQVATTVAFAVRADIGPRRPKRRS